MYVYILRQNNTLLWYSIVEDKGFLFFLLSPGECAMFYESKWSNIICSDFTLKTDLIV